MMEGDVVIMYGIIVRTPLNNSHVGHIAPADTLGVAGKQIDVFLNW